MIEIDEFLEELDEFLDESEELARRDWFGLNDNGESLPFHMDQRRQFNFLFNLFIISIVILIVGLCL
jgi:hypothetical protein